jgi:hypothetical protein
VLPGRDCVVVVPSSAFQERQAYQCFKDVAHGIVVVERARVAVSRQKIRSCPPLSESDDEFFQKKENKELIKLFFQFNCWNLF